MYLLDTNVISELRKAGSKKANKNVVCWAKSISSQELYLSAINILELELGIHLKKRKNPKHGAALRDWFDSQVLHAFKDRILVVDTSVAQCCAHLHVPNPQPERDALIAATALVHQMTVVTRNVSDFESTGVPILNPWNHS